ncbi:MAG TPA: hypothetical protein VM557_00720 [Thermoanaerobaculia bacterium]|nr:hypothetical protein [Thermoanaerobaculia bacterium]
MNGLRYALVLGALAIGAAPAAAQEWRLFGSNEITIESYEVGGEDESASPFRFEGTFLTNRLDFGLARVDDLGRRIVLRGELLGTNSDYFAEEGVVVGTLAVEIEDGSAAVPYRFAAGDVDGDLSRRVLQRQVRGARVELQPQIGRGAHSVVFVTGGGEPDWRHAFEGQLTFSGLSWLWQSEPGTTSVAANLVDAHQDAGSRGAIPIPAVDRDQQGGSLFAATELAGVRIEGEVAVLGGDDAAEGDDTSFYAEVTRAGEGLEWRLRFEENGAGYVPIGGPGIISNRRIGEVHARLRVGARSQLRGRAQFVEQNLEGAAPRLDTELFGLAYEGRPLAARRAFRVRLYSDLSSFESADRTTDRRFESWGLEADDRFANFDLRGRARRSETRDDVHATANRVLTELGFDAGRSFRRSEISGRVAIGLGWREQDRNAEYDTWSPIVEASIRRGIHSLALHLGFMDQDFVAATTDDLRYQTRRLIYSLGFGAHSLFLEAGQELREREPGLDMRSSRVALRYRYAFEKEF